CLLFLQGRKQRVRIGALRLGHVATLIPVGAFAIPKLVSGRLKSGSCLLRKRQKSEPLNRKAELAPGSGRTFHAAFGVNPPSLANPGPLRCGTLRFLATFAEPELSAALSVFAFELARRGCYAGPRRAAWLPNHFRRTHPDLNE